jgi:hypothetical protein
VTITDSLVIQNQAGSAAPGATAGGGGISSNGPLTVTGSTIRDNLATLVLTGTAAGGGIATTAALTLTNSTVSGNTAETPSAPGTASGGGLMLGADATINNCTIADNEAMFGAVATSGIATVTFRNTIVADSVATQNCDTTLSTGTIVGNAYNLDDDGTCGFSGTDLVGVDPLLGPLQYNGGAFTHMLLPGSFAIDAGSPAVPGSGGGACQAADQRGVARPQGARCDIGSVEVEDPVPATVCPPSPLAGCAAAGKSLLLIKDRASNGASPGDKLIWKWLKGPPIMQQDFGDPTTTAIFRLCVYAGTAAALEAKVDPDGMCGGTPCWKPVGTTGYKRTDISADSFGISKIILKGSDVASSKIIVKGKDSDLDLDAATLPLDVDAGITVQASNSDNTNCWQSTYAPDAVKTNNGAVFRAKVP